MKERDVFSGQTPITSGDAAPPQQHRLDAFEGCVRRGRLVPITASREMLIRDIRIAQEDLRLARKSFGNGLYESTVTQASFAMRRSAVSLLLAAGYKATTFYGLIVGITRLYVSTARLEARWIGLMEISKEKRDIVLGGARCQCKDAAAFLDTAERLVARTCELLDVPNVTGHRGL